MPPLAIVPRAKLQAWLLAAQQVMQTLNDGILSAAFNGDEEKTSLAVSAFDRLEQATQELVKESNPVSPFLRYRAEIMADTPQGEILRSLAFDLYAGTGAGYGPHAANNDTQRIMLEMQTAWATHRQSHGELVERIFNAPGVSAYDSDVIRARGRSDTTLAKYVERFHG